MNTYIYVYIHTHTHIFICIHTDIALQMPKEGLSFVMTKGIFRSFDCLPLDMDDFTARAPKKWRSRAETRVINVRK